MARLIHLALALLTLAAVPATTEELRIATFSAALSRSGPGLLLRDILREEEQAMAAAAIVGHVAPDILLLTEFDYDHGLAALGAFAQAAAARGAPDYLYLFALRPNAGMATGLDLDRNGWLGDARDAQGFGQFAGDGGMALLSRWPILTDEVQDFSALLWRDLPGAVLPRTDGAPFHPESALAVQRLSSSGHWSVPIAAPGGRLTLLAYAATTPVFDGAEDRNGLRNRDELRLWQAHLEGQIGIPPNGAFVLLGKTNLVPFDGEGIRAAMAELLSDPRLQDSAPASKGGAAAADPRQLGDPSLDTADWDEGGPGNLRVSYVLPSADWQVADAGVFWPAPGDAAAALLGEDGLAAGPHRLVWVDLRR